MKLLMLNPIQFQKRTCYTLCLHGCVLATQANAEPEMRVNVIPNPGFEDGDHEWSIRNWWNSEGVR